MFEDKYKQQVELLLRCLPAFRNQNDFIIKGGTAINLFYQNMPRLSVDIDLVYPDISDRKSSIDAIHKGLARTSAKIKQFNPHVQIIEQRSKDKELITRLIVRSNQTAIKIEPNYIMRGSLMPHEMRSLNNQVVNSFGQHIDNIPILAFDEVYAGKICAGLSRQHPRDLFDIMLLMKEKIPDSIRHVFVVYLACNPRPIHELLNPNRIDISETYETQFRSMTEIPITLDQLIQTREEVIKWIHSTITNDEREFILSVKKGNPKYELMNFQDLDKLPALKWKLMNIKKMDRNKHNLLLKKLESVLDN